MSKSNRPYRSFAEIFDRTSGRIFSAEIVNYSFTLLKRFKCHPKSVLDLCCGTGTAAAIYAENGLSVVGLDQSKEMLKIARKKCADKKLDVKFVNQSLPNFAITGRRAKRIQTFDLVTCFYDSLNYQLKESEIKRTFKNVNKHLNPDGMFIFDMHTFHAFKHNWTKTIAGEKNDLAWIWNAEINDKKKIANLMMTIFLKKGRHWERFDELHTERAYSNRFVRNALNQAGFKILGFYHCFRFGKPTAKTNRIAVVALKKN